MATKEKLQKTAARVKVTDKHLREAANVIQSDARESHPENLLARILAVEDKIAK